MRRRLQEQAAARPPLLLSVCRLSQEELHTMGQMLADPGFKDKAVSKLREVARVAPPPPTAEVQQALRDTPVYQDTALPQKPTWLAPMCWHRAFFRGCALQFDTGHGKIWVKFLYATQSPQSAIFCRLQEHEHYLDMVRLSGTNWEAVGAQHYEHRFAMDFEAICPWHELPQVSEDAIHVLMDVHCLPGNCWASASELVPLTQVVSWLPESSSAKLREQKPEKVSQAAEAEILANHPFLRDFLEKQTEPGSSSQVSTPYEEKEVDAEPGTLTDEQLQGVFDALDKKRQEWAEDEVPYDGEFRITLVGGP